MPRHKGVARKHYLWQDNVNNVGISPNNIDVEVDVVTAPNIREEACGLWKQGANIINPSNNSNYTKISQTERHSPLEFTIGMIDCSHLLFNDDYEVYITNNGEVLAVINPNNYDDCLHLKLTPSYIKKEKLFANIIDKKLFLIVSLQSELDKARIGDAILNLCLHNSNSKPLWYRNESNGKENSVSLFMKLVLENSHNQNVTKKELQNDLFAIGMRTRLRDYQLEGVYVMFMSYLNDMFIDLDKPFPSAQFGSALGYLPIKSIDEKKTLWYDLYTGELSPAEPIIATRIPNPKCFLLCDEMGLGKTLQILSLILLVKKYNADNNLRVVSQHKNLASQIGIENIINNQRLQIASSCYCENENSTGGLIECSSCHTFCHCKCAGIADDEVVDVSQIKNYCIINTKYECMPCACKRGYRSKIKSNAALIVIPDTLIAQWTQEIRKHTNSSTLNVFIYEGLQGKRGGGSCRVRYDPLLNPLLLAEYDVIIIGFKALVGEYHLATQQENIMNNVTIRTRASRSVDSQYFPPPIVCLHFNIIIVDETQRLESEKHDSANKPLKMTMMLSGKFLVCVSGTPLLNSKLEDLYPIIKFFGVEPFAHNKIAWNNMFTHQIVNSETVSKWLFALCKNFVLYRSKNSVKSQLGLKDKIVILKQLTFSTFEMALYLEKQDKLIKLIGAENSRVNIDNINQSVESLRKGCCHPSCFDSIYSNSKSAKKRNNNSSGAHTVGGGAHGKIPRPFSEIMILKIEQIKNVCEEKFRSLLFHSFTLVGSLLLMSAVANSTEYEHLYDDYFFTSASLRALALEMYSFVLRLVERNQSIVKLTSLVKIQGGVYYDHGTCADAEFITTKPIQLLWCIVDTSLCSTAESSNKRRKLTNMEWASLDATQLPAPSEEEMRNPAAEFPACSSSIHAKLTFHSNKKIASMLISQDVSDSIQYMSTKMKVNEVYSLLFPRDIVLQVITSVDDTATDIFHGQIPFPVFSSATFATSSDNSFKLAPFSIPNITNYNSRKSYRILIQNVHSTALLVKLSESLQYEYKWDSIEAVDMAHANIIALNVELGEPSVELDVFQELHLYHNIQQVYKMMESNNEKSDISSALLVKHLSNDLAMSERYLHHELMNHNESRITVAATSTEAVSSQLEFEMEADNADPHKIIDRIRAKQQYIEDNYMRNVIARDLSAKHSLEGCANKIQAQEIVLENLASTSNISRTWWISAITEICSSDSDTFLSHLHNTIVSSDDAYTRFKSFQSFQGLILIMSTVYSELIELRQKALNSLSELESNPSQNLIDESSNCRVCRDYLGKTGAPCFMCTLHEDVLKAYESHIVTYKTKTSHLVSKNNGAFKDVDNEDLYLKYFDEGKVDGGFLMIMKYLKLYINRNNLRAFAALAKEEEVLLGLLQAELRAMFAYWGHHLSLLKSFDELNQCKERIALKLYDDGAHGGLHAHELHQNCLLSIQSSILAEKELVRHKSTLCFYRNQEEDSRKQKQSTEEVDECIICKDPLYDLDQANLVMLPCFHIYHRICVFNWVGKHRKCPFCSLKVTPNDLIPVSPMKTRERTTVPKVTIMSSLSSSTDIAASASRQIKLEGEYGTKLEQILLDIMLILMDNEKSDDKIVVFSEWMEMLSILSFGLQQNRIKHSLCTNKNTDFKQHGSLQEFKHRIDVRVLLLPLYLGAEGLDLIVASHVFLIEPIRKESIERQAINRCHRLGNTKQTYVYKYYLKDTIEEKMITKESSLQDDDGIEMMSSKKKEDLFSLENIKYLLNL